ncbi:MAG: glycosyltransferase family 2 protein [bacterium]
MTSPYLSILLPTKNRSHLVDLAVRSVLQQDFDDYELIICDNDDDPAATRSALQKHLDNPRVNYIRTGGISMVDNWNRALKSARGKHITVLEDKMIFYPDSFRRLSSKIAQSPTGVVVWEFDTIEDEHEPARLKQIRSSEDRVLNTDEVLDLVTSDIVGNWTILPRGLATSLPRTLVEAIVRESGKYFFEPLSPDFVSALKVLASIDSYLLTSDVYSLVTSNKVSNGRASLIRKTNNYMLGQDQMVINLDLVPVKSKLILANVLVIDYRSQAAAINGKLSDFPISHPNYLRMMTIDLLKSTGQARRVVWNIGEIKELFLSEKKLLSNCLHIAKYSLKYLIHRLGTRIGAIRPQKGHISNDLDQDALCIADKFLSGDVSIGDKSPFRTQ